MNKKIEALKDVRRLIGELEREWKIRCERVIFRDQFSLGMMVGLQVSQEIVNKIIRDSSELGENNDK